MPKPTTLTGGATVEMVPVPEMNYDAVHALEDIVRLHEYVGSKKARDLIYRVVALPDPNAKRKAERENYAIEPIAGGPRTRAENWMLVPGSAADKAVADRTPRVVQKFYAGNIVILNGTVRLTGVDAGQRLVILDIARDGKVKLTKEGGDEGRYYTGIPLSALSLVDL